MTESAIARDGACSERTPLQRKGGASISTGQIAILVVALFIKGGLLGAYIPFSSLWLSLKGYRPRDLGFLSLVDALGCLFLPVVGICVDKLRAHNACFVLILCLLCILKLAYLPAANSFTAIILLTAVTAPLLRASNSMLDALALYAFPDKAHFSRARLAGDLGFGCIALGVGFAMDFFGTEDTIFYIFACMCGSLACMWCATSPYMESIRADSAQMSLSEFRQNVKQLWVTFGSWDTCRALFILYIVGCSLGLISTFEFVLLKDMMGSGALLGLCKAAGTLASVPVWWWVINLMDCIGFKNVQLIGCLAAGMRCGILGIITKPWHALISEMLCGPGGFALTYASIVVFSGRVVREDMKGTVQTLVFVIFVGIGAGGSPLLGSLIVERWGIQAMFLCMAALSVFVCLLFLTCDIIAVVRGSYRSLEEVCGREEDDIVQSSDSKCVA